MRRSFPTFSEFLSIVFGVLVSSIVLGLLVVWAVITGSPFAQAQVSPPPHATSDPCLSPYVVKTAVAVNVSSATTTELAAAATNRIVFLCGFSATVTGTSPTILFLRGTKTTNPCDTGAANLSGTYAPTSGALVTLPSAGMILSTPASNELCLTSGGTGPSVQGIATIVQQ